MPPPRLNPTDAEPIAKSAQHILTFAKTLDAGGVERAQLRLITQWLGLNRRITLVLGDRGDPSLIEDAPGLDVITLGSRHYLALTRVRGIVRAMAPDVIFCPGNHYTSIAAYLRLTLGRRCPPIVGKMSNAVLQPGHGPIAAAANRWWLTVHRHFLDHVVAMSPATAAAAVEALRSDAVSIIPNPPRPEPDRIDRIDVPADPYILGVGRLEPQKRWDRLIDAFAAIKDGRARLVIVGRGSLRADLIERTRTLDIAGHVDLIDDVADPRPLMASAALLALVSDYEGVPGVLIEARSVGTPIVATRSSPSIAEIVSDATFGTIVGRDDPTALQAALRRWLAPDAVKPTKQPPAGLDSAQRYLDVFDQLVVNRAASPR